VLYFVCFVVREDNIEDFLGASNETESDRFVNTDSDNGFGCGTFTSGGSTGKPCLFQESHFPVCTRVNSGSDYGISVISGSYSGHVNYTYTRE
jgi:hypothetical protein